MENHTDLQLRFSDCEEYSVVQVYTDCHALCQVTTAYQEDILEVCKCCGLQLCGKCFDPLSSGFILFKIGGFVVIFMREAFR